MVQPKDLGYYQDMRCTKEQRGLNPAWLLEKLEEKGEKRWFVGSVSREDNGEDG